MAVLDWLQQYLGGQPDQGAPMAIQNRQGGFDPYRPGPSPDALQLLQDMTGATDLGQAYQAYQRGEYLPAFGQGAWGAAQAATMALPALKAGGAALKGAAPLAREAAAAIPGLLADETGAIRAYHGSPHLFPPEPGKPLGRFDVGKIGTGEGNQTFMRGLYFSEAEDVGKRYREMLSGQSTFSLIGPDERPIITGIHSPRQFHSALNEPLRRAMPPDVPYLSDSIARLWSNGEPITASSVIREAWGGLELPKDMLPKITASVEDAIERAKPVLTQYRIETTQPGHMYEVNLHAEPEQFLHGDLSFANQPPPVQRALKEIGVPEGMGPTNAGEAMVRAANNPYRASDVFNRGGDPVEMTAADVAARLQQAGIPGNRYFDQWSRGAGEGTYNYSVWDDKIIEIMRRYGILPPAVAAGGGLLGAGSEPPT